MQLLVTGAPGPTFDDPTLNDGRTRFYRVSKLRATVALRIEQTALWIHND